MLHGGDGIRKSFYFFNANELEDEGNLFVDVNECVRYLMANMSAMPLELKPNSNLHFKSLKYCVIWLFPLKLTMLGQSDCLRLIVVALLDYLPSNALLISFYI